MLGGKENNKDYKVYYDLMIEELDRANSIISEFLSIARGKSDQRIPRYLDSIIKTIHPIIQAEALMSDKEVVLVAFSLSSQQVKDCKYQAIATQ
ncbi:MAG: hypothetical protein CVU90_04745 [Firmicutes bacterium HGW-Firmicutes-15]|nr:MAG: hypothetical protein CVU90_04745 [Firmicutes bacterium HGW-Firmicutes-15]